MITKEIRLSKIQILDEREPDAGRLGLNMQVRLALELHEAGVRVDQLENYPIRYNPDMVLDDCCAEVNRIVGEQGFTPIPVELHDRIAALVVADHDELSVARWNVTRDREAIKRLQSRINRGEDLVDVLGVAAAQLTQSQEVLNSTISPCPSEAHREVRFSLASVLPDGSVEVRLRKCVCEGGQVISPAKYHRVVLHPGADVEATLSMINQSLQRDLGLPALPTEDLNRVGRVCAIEHTPEAIAARKERE